MEAHDDDLRKFEADGGSPLPATNDQGYVEHDGARIWYTCYGSGSPVILLHGGFGHSGNWGYQVPALVRNDYRAILLDSRGHGRSTRDSRPFSYDLMASDVLAMRSGGLERRRVHEFDPRCEGSCAHCGRVLLCLQNGPGRREANHRTNPILDRCF